MVDLQKKKKGKNSIYKLVDDGVPKRERTNECMHAAFTQSRAQQNRQRRKKPKGFSLFHVRVLT